MYGAMGDWKIKSFCTGIGWRLFGVYVVHMIHMEKATAFALVILGVFLNTIHWRSGWNWYANVFSHDELTVKGGRGGNAWRRQAQTGKERETERTER